MKYFAGLDVSLKEISICVVDADGTVVAHGRAPADPEGVAGWFRNRSLTPDCIVHESVQLSIWLQRGLKQLRLPVVCIDARKAHKSLSARAEQIRCFGRGRFGAARPYRMVHAGSCA